MSLPNHSKKSRAAQKKRADVWDDAKNLAEYRAPPKTARKRSSNPLLEGINNYLPDFHKQVAGANDFLPSRYVLYSPMLLLPGLFETISPFWEAEYECLDDGQKQELFQSIATAFSDAGQKVTHMAIMAPIGKVSLEDSSEANVMRSPTGLRPVHGDWGPASTLQALPTKDDLERAFWVSTRQDLGITQTWAPRWTMFSHGNLSEKKRVMGDARQESADYFRDQSPGDIANMEVLDMYVGIGYFALCYIARGVRRVWGWDLNGWSIEGLRRGCAANGWKYIVVEVAADGQTTPSIPDLVRQLEDEENVAENERTRCIAFRGDNKYAVRIMEMIEDARRVIGVQHPVLRFDHINLGLLPSSMPSWSTALRLAAPEARIHLHENFASEAVSSAIESMLADLAVRQGRPVSTQVIHVERVKRYGPRVWHTVLDVAISPKVTAA